MQLAADYFVFELRDQIKNPQQWDAIGATMVSKSIGSAQSPSRMEREFIQPMRILALSFLMRAVKLVWVEHNFDPATGLPGLKYRVVCERVWQALFRKAAKMIEFVSEIIIKNI